MSFLQSSFDCSQNCQSPAKPLQYLHPIKFAEMMEGMSVTYLGMIGCDWRSCLGSGAVSLEVAAGWKDHAMPHLLVLPCANSVTRRAETFKPWSCCLTVFSVDFFPTMVVCQ